jgi:hypothetical protein
MDSKEMRTPLLIINLLTHEPLGVGEEVKYASGAQILMDGDDSSSFLSS